jgi:hypothetical protein
MRRVKILLSDRLPHERVEENLLRMSGTVLVGFDWHFVGY